MGAFKVDVGIHQPWRQKLVFQRVGLIRVLAAAARMDDALGQDDGEEGDGGAGGVSAEG